jgi:hypothetical protein
MSKQTVSKTQASKSVPEDSLGATSKSAQKPNPAHEYSGDRTSLDINESRDRTAKKKAEPAHIGPRSVSDERETITKKNLETKKRK